VVLVVEGRLVSVINYLVVVAVVLHMDFLL
jgi:hypothetical protein